MKYKLVPVAIALALLASVVVAQSDDKVYEPTEVTRKAKITLKPEPRYTAKAREHEIEGTVILRLVLRANGEITDIEVVQGLPYGKYRNTQKPLTCSSFSIGNFEGRRVTCAL